MEVVYSKAPYGRRMFAALFDLACLFVLGSLLAWAYSLALPSFSFYKEAQETSLSLQKESHLFVEKNGALLKIDKAYEGEKKEEANTSYEEALEKFYLCDAFFPNGDGPSLYEEQKIGEKAIVDKEGFTYWEKSENGLLSPKKDKTAEEMNEFYMTALNDYAYSYMNLNKDFVSASRTIAYAGLYCIPVVLNISLLVFGLIVPLSLRRGKKTLGKLVFGLGVLDVHGLSPKWWHYLLRFLFLLFLEVDLSLITFGLPLIVSFSMFVFGKRGQCLHDYVTNTYVVDAKNKKIYLDAKEYSIAQEKLQKISLENNDFQMEN